MGTLEPVHIIWRQKVQVNMIHCPGSSGSRRAGDVMSRRAPASCPQGRLGHSLVLGVCTSCWQPQDALLTSRAQGFWLFPWVLPSGGVRPSPRPQKQLLPSAWSPRDTTEFQGPTPVLRELMASLWTPDSMCGTLKGHR